MRSYHVESLSCALECLYASSNLLFRMSSTQLHTDSCLSSRHDREAEADHENVLFQHTIGELSGQSSIT